MGTNVIDGTRKPLGYVQTADLSTAVNLSPPAGARTAIVQAVGNDVSWRDDGTDAGNTAGGTAGGMLLASGQSFLYIGNLFDLSFIEAVAAATAYVNVAYYK